MISTAIRVTTGLALVLCLAACGNTPPSTYYRLTPTVTSTAGSQHPALGIGPVEIPEFLNRNALVYSRGDNKLEIASNERWAEPLEDGVKRVFGLNLAHLMNSENLRYFPWSPREAPQYGVALNVLDLDAEDQQATLVVEWRLYRPGSGETISRRISRLEQALSAGAKRPEALAPAYSALLYQLSEVIAAAIRADQAQVTGDSPGD